MYLENLTGPLLFLAGTIFMLLVVPWQRIKELFAIGLVAGIGMAILLNYLMQNVLAAWVYHRVDIFSPAGIPFFLSAAWTPIIITFCHLLSQYKNLWLPGILLGAFPVGATFLQFLLRSGGLLEYNNWNLLYTFLVSLVIHLGIATYLHVTGRLENLQLT